MPAVELVESRGDGAEGTGEGPHVTGDVAVRRRGTVGAEHQEELVVVGDGLDRKLERERERERGREGAQSGALPTT